MPKQPHNYRLIAAVFALTVGLTVAGCGASDSEKAPSKVTSPVEVAKPSPSTAGDSKSTETAPTTEGKASQQTASAIPNAVTPQGKLTVHYIDVGQGDATLLQGPDFTVLIDAGRHDRSDVVPYLRSAGVTSLDLVIGTHPHADHIGQMDKVIAAFPVKEAWLSGDRHTSQTFERVLDAILASDADYHEPKAGEVFTFGSLRLEVLNPDRLTGDLHEGSIAVRAAYGDVAFLFTGDAEVKTEQAMVQRGHAPNAQILQLGHHGSRTSSTAVFLGAVKPEVAIYSAGASNSYGHPHAEVLDRLAEMDIPVHGTDINGTIRVVTDGVTYEVILSKQGQARAPPTQTDPTPPPAPAPTPAPTPPASPGCQAGQVNINTASIDDLKLIKHIGDVRAAELVRLRPFRSVDELTRISGIAAARLRDIKAQGLACVGG